MFMLTVVLYWDLDQHIFSGIKMLKVSIIIISVVSHNFLSGTPDVCTVATPTLKLSPPSAVPAQLNI